MLPFHPKTRRSLPWLPRISTKPVMGKRTPATGAAIDWLESRMLFSGLQTFTALDAGAGPAAARPNSDAEAAAFDSAAAAIGTESIITFEGAPTGGFNGLTVAPGVTISGADLNGNPQQILAANADASAPRLAGYNTTADGSEFVNVYGGSVTFTFATPIQFFGAYFPGAQTFVPDSIQFSDDSTETVRIPGGSSTQGGVSFAGFTDQGASITSVTVNGGSFSDWDAFGIDDVRYQSGADLAGKFSGPNIPTELFPGESGTTQFTITNNSATEVTDDIDTQFYLETAPAFGNGDIPIGDPTLGDADAPVRDDLDLQPGDSTSPIDLNFTIPPTTERGNYYIVGDVDPGNAGGNINSATGAAVDQTFSTPVTIDVVKPAEASSDVYTSGTQAPTGYSFYWSLADGDFLANAYENADGSQVIVAFRGTVFTDLQNWTADASFVGTSPNPTLERYANDAALVVREVHAELPDAHIMLTGHSLGGALAQLVGEESGLLVDAFNAPGAAQLFDALVPELSPAAGLDSNQSNTNYRIFGDQVSLAGKPIGTTVVLPNPPGTTFSTVGLDGYGMAETKSAALENLTINSLTFYGIHSIDKSVLPDVISNYSAYMGTDEPNDVLAFESLAQPTSTSSSDGTSSEVYQEAVTAGAAVLFDPSGSDFILTGQSGSPAFSSVDLPTLPGVASFNVRYETAGTWSSFASAMPGSTYTVGDAASAVEFQPLDPAGDNVQLASSFAFGATFASTGTFTGTLVESGLSSAATPGTLLPAITRESLKSSFVGGIVTRGNAVVSLTNVSTTTDKGAMILDLYASPDGLVDSSSQLIATVKRNIKLPAGKSLHMTVTGTIPANLTGKYSLLAETTDPAGYTTDGSDGPNIDIAAPFLSLSATIAANKSGTIELTVTNNGNFNATGSLAITLAPSTDGVSPVPGITLAAPIEHVNLKPGRSGRYAVHFKVPAALAAGVYYPLATITFDGVATTAVGPQFTVG